MSYNLVEIDPISGEHKLKKVAGLSKLNVWTGTQSDYNAQKNTIPNGSYVNITDDAESGNGIKDIYSTDEVKTNKVWIDGKPIYRKCGFIQSISAKTEKILDSTLTTSSVDVIVQNGGCITTTNGVKLFIGGYSGASYRANLTIRNNGLIFLSSEDAYNNVYWWIEYTKK